jgi:hypothetical protein
VASAGDPGDQPTRRGQDRSGGRRLTVSPEAYSFLLFCALAVSAIALFPDIYLLFVAIVAVDGIATLVDSDSIVSVDRAALFLVLVVLSVAVGPHDLLSLFLRMILAIAALDMSFLLRRLRGTVIDASVIERRLGSYAYTLVPAFLLSYLLTYLYSSLSGLSPPEPVALLAVSSTSALLIIYVVSRYLTSHTADRR